jgi:hypothetical protein
LTIGGEHAAVAEDGANLDCSELIFAAHPFSPSETTPSAPHAPVLASALCEGWDSQISPLVFYAFCVIEEALNRTYGGNHSLV